jgi:hypothetical protein
MGATIFKKGEYNHFLKWWIGIRRHDVLKSISKLKYLELESDGLHYILSLYSKKSFSTIASGATPIGSAERAPDDIS